jgi:hypothetical protein
VPAEQLPSFIIDVIIIVIIIIFSPSFLLPFFPVPHHPAGQQDVIGVF